MPRVKTTLPSPTRDTGQRSLDLPLYLDRILPAWTSPEWLHAGMWRRIVQNQPVATVCRETLIANIMSLDWKVEPRDTEKRDEYEDDIEYYTTFFENTGDYDYTHIIDWVCGDVLDIPFGAGVEVGHENDEPNGKVLWIELLDGATLFPTQNRDFPVGQSLPEVSRTVYFPDHAINRVYYSPRREIKREGWSMAPPEKIYLALEALNRGDIYYTNLLLDTPASGILDLGDMAKDSAEIWVKAWRSLLTGIDPFKIPVLYEHEKPVNWIPFTKNPADLMFDKAVFRFGSLVTAGYGMSLSDIGVPTGMSGGETLSGTIRQERGLRKNGLARLKRKVALFFNRMLPPYLAFKFVDMDDEVSVAVGRARLATATALQQMIDSGMLSPEEGRQQLIADGLLTISIPEKVPAGVLPKVSPVGGNERTGMLGRPIAPSQGGFGESKALFNLMSLPVAETDE